MKFIYKYIALFSCLGSFAQTLTSPQISCVNVLPNGNITITWSVTPGLSSQFANYVIYTSPALNDTPYTQQAIIANYNTSSYTINTINNANTQPYFICIQTINSSHQTLPVIDTVRTLYLTVHPTAPGVASLQWNGFSQPVPAGEEKNFLIYRNYLGTWTNIASVPFTQNANNKYSYSDTLTYCDAYILYKVELTDSILPCTSVSDTAGGRFQNKNKPTIPGIDSVSTVNNGTQAIIGLSPAYSKNVVCFIVYTYSASTYVLVDSVCTSNRDTTYIDTNVPSGPSVGSVTITAVSKDSCGNKSQFPLLQQCTIYTNVSYDECRKTADIAWTPYQNMVTGVHDYQVFCSTNHGPFVYIGDTNTTVYYHKGLAPGTTYCYFVRAHSNGKTKLGKDTASSTSNQFCITTSSPPISSFAYLSNVTVNAQQTIDVLWDVDNTVAIGGYNLFRATSKTGPYNLITYIPSANNFTDGNVNTNNQEYFYYVQVLDTCKNPTISTQDTSNSIVLKAVPAANLKAILNWNGYAKYLGGVSGYTIYRSVNNGAYAIAATTNSLVTTYTDDLSPFAADEGVFLYYIQAIEGPGNPYGLAEISQSNTDTVYMDANLYIPNCFTPNGKNKVFLPIGAYIDNTNYSLDIFDRYGVKIFESTDPNTGWDGGGHQEGIYAYTVKYQTSIGEFRQRNGTVTLLK